MEVRLSYNLDLGAESVWNMISATAASKGSLLYLQEVGDFYAGPQYYTTREGFASYLLKITIDGRGLLRYGGQTYEVPAGSFYWVDCTKWHDYRTDPEAGHWHVIWVHFYGANAQFYYESFLKSNSGEPVGMLPPGSRAHGALWSLLELDNSGINQQETDFRAAELLTQLLSACLLSTLDQAAQGDIPRHIETIRQYVQRHYAKKLTLQDLGNQFNMNPCYVQKQFKRYVGQSPTEYQIYLRMTRAKELMRTTHKSISEIAYEVGVDNLGYFTRLFKKQEGLTPQQYRKLWPIVGRQEGGSGPTV